MMKRNFYVLVILGWCTALSTTARERTDAEMQAIAAQCLQGTMATATPYATPYVAPMQVAAEGAYCIYAGSQGFVVVSRDDSRRPVLGYSRSAYDPDRLPDGLRWWLRQVAASQPEGTPTAQSLGLPTASVVEPFITTTWGQGAPYYYKCPKTTKGDYTLTGCVATAMAQCLKYYEYPAKGEGKCSIKYNGKEKSVTLNTTYDWANMKDSYAASEGSLTKPVTAVATLMRDCGYAVNMDYDTEGSGAMQDDAARALVYHFRFDSLAVKMYNRAFYCDEEWRALVDDALTRRMPILFGGNDLAMGAHEFVLCGRDADGLVYVNWGWEGDADGYFDLMNLNPSAYEFNSYQDIITGIAPPDETERTYESQWAVYGYEYLLDSTTPDELDVSFPFIMNVHYLDFIGKLGVYFERVGGTAADNQFVTLVDTEEEGESVPCFYGYGADEEEGEEEETPLLTETVSTADLQPGTYRVSLASQHVKEATPSPMRCVGGLLQMWVNKAADGTLTVYGAPPTAIDATETQETGDGLVRVFDLAGRLVYSAPRATFQTTAIPAHGILVVKDGTTTRRIMLP